MNYLLFCLLLLAVFGIALIGYGIYYYKLTGKMMGIGFVIIGMFLIYAAYEGFDDYRDALSDTGDRIASDYLGRLSGGFFIYKACPIRGPLNKEQKGRAGGGDFERNMLMV